MDSISKVGQYPQQLLQKLRTDLNIPLISFQKSFVTYIEKGKRSALTGKVIFTDISGSIRNIISNRQRHSVIEISTLSSFMNRGRLTTSWTLPIWSPDGAFRVKGKLSDFPMPALNETLNPLAMADAKSGNIERLDFTIDGDDSASRGHVVFLYRNLKIEVLKKTGEPDSLDKKELSSFIANLLIRDNNADAKQYPFEKERDIYRSLFNLLWRSVFEGAKKAM
jgi:hypothetical protein